MWGLGVFNSNFLPGDEVIRRRKWTAHRSPFSSSFQLVARVVARNEMLV